MKLCSWPAGCAQETSSHAELCEYHGKISGGLLGDSGEADKATVRLNIRREQRTPGRRHKRPDPIEEETTMNGQVASDERTVYFEPPHYAPGDIDAVLPDGTHLPSAYQLEGRRLGFDRSLPVGTLILLSGVRGWVVGASAPKERAERPPM